MGRFDKEDFYNAVYEVVSLIPKGRATSYAAIAKAIGYPTMARFVGRAMRESNFPKNTFPAHRVVNSQGVLSGKDFFEDSTAMMQLLESEGIVVINNRIQNWKNVFWNPMESII